VLFVASWFQGLRFASLQLDCYVMDNFLLHAITNELNTTLSGLRLGKVYQFGATDLALDFRLRDGRLLYLSTDPQRLALYLTARSVRQFDLEARHDRAFPALLKKYLGGAQLLHVEKLGYDRVVTFHFVAETDDGRPVQRALVCLLIGRAANVFLLEGQRIIATLREVTALPESYRDPAPPPDKLDPFLLTPEALTKLATETNGGLAAAAQEHLLGFTALYAAELAQRATRTDAHTALTGLLVELFEQPPQPVLYTSAPLEELQRDLGRPGITLTLAPIALTHQTTRATPFPTLNQAADAYFTFLAERRGFQSLRQQLHTQLTTKLKKQRALHTNLTREREGFSRGETQQRYGELLLANLQQAQKTAAGFVVTDFYDAALPQIIIPTAAKSTAQEAAEHYFKLARKARHGLQSLSQRLPQVAADIAKLEQQLAQLDQLTQRAELASFAQTCGLRPLPNLEPRAKAKPQPNKAAKAQPEKIAGMRQYRSSDGYEILVGRTDRDNDTLTFRVAKSFDLWFHVADYPGSHVLVRNPKRQPVPTRTITEAAQLAAQFSQARLDTRVAVNYCERKFVTKQKGFAPGQVRLSSFKTILVEPREAGERILS
jgi:predicted ribosome quality control (RQC) complex YloA/Tae2 family protein